MYKLRLSQSTQTVLVHRVVAKREVMRLVAARASPPPPPGGARLAPRVTGPAPLRRPAADCKADALAQWPQGRDF
ncbi:hypothetical protein E2C01_046845 [Portunus trituberculatus]|uniref:Uncharacterized protein n=1 Tax=Portunus trituberculatus TaxID=210409 RepID=A0A5B7G6T4_PORTR|nr:hypothetical protein [Portunus trituberculatus]